VYPVNDKLAQALYQLVISICDRLIHGWLIQGGNPTLTGYRMLIITFIGVVILIGTVRPFF
jgi:hypothetical protein